MSRRLWVLLQPRVVLWSDLPDSGFCGLHEVLYSMSSSIPSCSTLLDSGSVVLCSFQLTLWQNGYLFLHLMLCGSSHVFQGMSSFFRKATLHQWILGLTSSYLGQCSIDSRDLGTLVRSSADKWVLQRPNNACWAVVLASSLLTSFQGKDFTKFCMTKLVSLKQLCFLKNYVLVSGSPA